MYDAKECHNVGIQYYYDTSYANTHTHTQFESEIGQQSAEEDQVFLMAMQVICVFVNCYTV